MIVLGIDQGIANFGFAIIDMTDDSVKIIESGYLETPARHSLGKRLITIRSKIEELMEEYSPSLIGCERLFYNAPTGGRNKSLSMMHVNMVTGLLNIMSAEKGIRIGEHPPTTVKKVITGNGKASKEEVAKSIEPYLKKVVKKDHEIDAIAIGITAYFKDKEEDESVITEKKSKKGKKSK